MVSANNDIETMKKGIHYGACDYFVKPVRLEQLRGIWTHVVRNSKRDPRNSLSSGNGDADHKLRFGDGDGKGEKDGANNTKKYTEKKKNGVDGADEENEKQSTQKRERIQWPGELHHKFVEAVNQIGMDSKLPHVASFLYIKLKLNSYVIFVLS